jgi:hypothetical protein
MNLDVDYLIGFLNKKTDISSKEEVGEQEGAAPAAPASPAPSSGGGGGNIPKWEDLHNITRGKAQPLMKSGQKWTTGIKRDVANQIW